MIRFQMPGLSFDSIEKAADSCGVETEAASVREGMLAFYQYVLTSLDVAEVRACECSSPRFECGELLMDHLVSGRMAGIRSLGKAVLRKLVVKHAIREARFYRPKQRFKAMRVDASTIDAVLEWVNYDGAGRTYLVAHRAGVRMCIRGRNGEVDRARTFPYGYWLVRDEEGLYSDWEPGDFAAVFLKDSE